ncbi:MAG: DUF937 domain-containing protein [Pseudomonadota bacterium]
MNLLKLLQDAGGSKSLGHLAGAIGIDATQTQSLVSAVAPALLGGMQKQAGTDGGFGALENALTNGNHARYVDQPELMQDTATRLDGNKILGHLFGSKDVSRNVASDAAAKTGIDPRIIKQALPLVAGLAMGALSKQKSGNNLGGLLSTFVGDDGVGVDDVLSLARKFF